jgi:hypothetical protein
VSRLDGDAARKSAATAGGAHRVTPTAALSFPPAPSPF